MKGRPAGALAATGLLLAVTAPTLAGCKGAEVPAEVADAGAPPTPPVRRDEGLEDLGARYTVRVPEPAHHLLEVEVEAALGPDEPAPEAWLPVWTPGSYLVREHARHVERFEAFDAAGRPLPVRKTAKNRWRVLGAPGGAVRYRYVLYAHDLSVRTAFVADDFGVLDPAAVFVALAGREARPVQVRFELPEGWALRCVGAAAKPGQVGRLRAERFEALLERPCLLGPVQADTFEVDGVPHALAYVGRTERWDRPRAVRDVRRIVEAERDFWGGRLPYRHYTFLQVLERRRGMGGLEHAQGTLLLAPPLAMRDEERYRDWLGLLAHELFHAWNVKRLRPVELRRYELQREQLTPSLWIAEGLTSYYDDLLLARAGLLDETAYLKRLSTQIEAVQRTPGRAWQSLVEASWDAWIKYYRPGEQSPNATVSYYRKGAVVGWLLDATIREATGGRRSLDDALRLAFERFGDGRGYGHDEFRQVLEEVAGRSLRDFYAAYVEGTEELDYTPALRWFGLRFAERPSASDDGKEAPPAAWLGVDLEGGHGQLRLRHVLRDGPGWRAGLSAGDELLAIDGYRVGSSQEVERLLRRLRPGERVEVTVARRTRLRRLQVELGTAPSKGRWRLEPDPAASGVQRARRADWLAPAATGGSVLLGAGAP